MENILKVAVYTILAAAETWIGYRFFNTYLIRNEVKQKWYYCGAVGYFSFQLWSYLAACPLFSTAEYYFVFSTTIALLFFSDSIQNKVTISWMYVLMNYACKTTVTAVRMGYGQHYLTELNNTHGIILDGWTQFFACILFVIALGGLIGLQKLRLQKQFVLYSGISYLFPVTMLGLAILAYRNIAVGFDEPSHLAFYTYISVLLFSATLALFYLLEKTILLDVNSEKSAVMEELLALQREHYGKLETSQRETRSLRHDIKHHLQYIQSMLDMHKYDDANAYISKIYENNHCLRGITYSGNIAIDSTLSHSLGDFAAKGIDLKYSIILPPTLVIEDLDLCILFGNLVDNAVEACQRIEDGVTKKFININAKIQKEYLFVTISNSFTGEVKFEKNIYRTIKGDERYCGIGLANIKRLVEKYDGEISVEHTDKVFTVAAILALRPLLQKEKVV